MSNPIKLFWFSKKNLYNIDVENFGDMLSKYIVEKISNRSVVWQDPRKCNFIERYFSTTYFAIGSILHFATKNCTIWGSGLIDSKSFAPNAKYLAVRGKYSYEILKNKNFKLPQVFGDPAILLSNYIVKKKPPSKLLGIIPHYTEVDHINKALLNDLSNEIIIIDNREPIQKVIESILSCEYIISSSLHGLIVPMAFEIPSLRINISNNILGDGIKYYDYLSSVNIEYYKPFEFKCNDFNVNEIISHIEKHKKLTMIQKDIVKVQEKLLEVNPF
jgi:hypothetical protein